MRKLLLSALLCATAPLALAQESQPTNSVLQLFSCKLNPGQNADDVFSLLEALRDQDSGTGADGFGIFLWTPFRVTTEYDYIWGTTNQSLIDTMDGMAEYMRSPRAGSMASRFQAVNARCDSMIAFSELTHASSEAFDPANAFDRTTDGLVETFLCRNREGSDMDDVRGATKAWQDAMSKLGSTEMAKYNGYLVMPFRGGNGDADWGWIGTFPDMGSFGRGSTDYMNSKEGQAADARFEKVSTCRSGLWQGYWLLYPQAPASD
jgi:hypothetical protein